jgi:hypothetical protein
MFRQPINDSLHATQMSELVHQLAFPDPQVKAKRIRQPLDNEMLEIVA